MTESQQASLPMHGAEPPLYEDAEYPEILRELAEVIDRELRNIGLETPYAAAVAETVTEHVRERFGGSPIYISKAHTLRQRRRRAAMWADFNGRNHVELSRKYGVCVQQLYRSIAIARAEETARRQGNLFDGPAAS